MMTAVISVIDSKVKENWQTKYQNILYQKIEMFRQHVPYEYGKILTLIQTTASQSRLTDGHQLRFCSSLEKTKTKQNPKTTTTIPKIPPNSSKNLDQLKQNKKGTEQRYGKIKNQLRLVGRITDGPLLHLNFLMLIKSVAGRPR